MENKPRRAVRITIISIFFIAGSGLALPVCGLMIVMGNPGMPHFGGGGDFSNDINLVQSPFTLALLAVWSAGMLASSIGLLMRKNAFRILFVVFLIIAGAGFIVMGFNSIAQFDPSESSSFSLFRMPGMNALMPVVYIIQTVALIAGCIVLIALVMSRKASGDFRKKEEDVK